MAIRSARAGSPTSNRLTISVLPARRGVGIGQPILKCGQQRVHAHGLGEDIIHACRQAARAIVAEGACSHGEHGDVPACRLPAAASLLWMSRVVTRPSLPGIW